MYESFLRSDPPCRIEGETFVQQIDKRYQQLVFVVLEFDGGRGHQPCTQIASRLGDMHLPDDVLIVDEESG
jgi:hypothetical protein